ncbi:MAG: helix-turn-helix transcriptional regulator [Patescibacteria group bacterium]
MIQVGKKIRQIREEYNLSQERFGKKVGVSGKAVSSYETGRSVPPLSVIEKIADNYNTSFLHLKDEKKTDLELKIQQIKSSLTEIEDILIKN